MKKLLLTGLLAGLAAVAYGQGQIALDNNANTSTDPAATANGLFFVNFGTVANPIDVPITNDFNVVFFGGSSQTSLQVLASFIGTAAGQPAHGGNAFGQGTFTDPTGGFYTIPGTSTSAFFQIEAWDGTATSFSAAQAGGAHVGQSAIFSNPVATPPTPQPDLTGMPAVVLASQVPEPSTFALAGLGAAALLIFRKRK